MYARDPDVVFEDAASIKASTLVEVQGGLGYCERPDGSLSLDRARLVSRYRERLADLTCVGPIARRPTLAFMPVLLPADVASRGREVVNALALQGIAACLIPGEIVAAAAARLAPFQNGIEAITDRIASRVLALPISDHMNACDVDEVADALVAVLAGIRARRRARALGLSVSVPIGVAA